MASSLATYSLSSHLATDQTNCPTRKNGNILKFDAPELHTKTKIYFRYTAHLSSRTIPLLAT
jgi:hypothetical protein